MAIATSAAVLAACTEVPPPDEQVPGAPTVATHIAGGDWPSYNRDLAGTRYSPLRQVNLTNVDELRQAWSYSLGGDALGASELTPLVIDGVLYATTGESVVALAADTGEEIWRSLSVDGVTSRRGLAYWRGAASSTPRILVTAGRALVALDAVTGKPVAGFGALGRVEMPVLYNAAPTVFEDLVIVGSQSPPGGIYAFAAASGALVWSFTSADEQNAGLEAPSSFTIDVDRALLFAVFAGSSADPYYGGRREGDAALADAVVAIEARTGRVRWHFQTVHHDVWDYDLLSPPVLLDATIDGARKPLLVQLSGAGYAYVLNRVTGDPLHGVTEVPVPASDVPGERTAVTQPIPVKPPPLARVSYTPEDLVSAADTTREHAAACRALREQSGGLHNAGPFTPFAFKSAGENVRSSLVFPGALAVGWGGAAADARSGVVIVNTTSVGALGWLEKNDADSTAAQTGTGARRAARPYRRASVGGDTNLDFAVSAPAPGLAGAGDAWPCHKPPWGELAAISVSSGEILWRVPLGVTEQLPEGRRATGRTNAGGAIATAAGLVFVGATNDRRFRAFDARGGRELWVTELPLAAHSVPITYLGADGKQYVVIAAGGAIAEPRSGAAGAPSLIAYALP